jgi:bisanhydrobacterioruberin hydratase
MNDDLSGAWRLVARSIIFVLGILFTVGVIGHAIDETLPLMLLLTPGFSLLTSLLVVVPVLAAEGWFFAFWLALAYALTFLAEVVGVATGTIFGEYAYGTTLGWAWHGVPLIIAFNWVMVVNGMVCIAGRVVPPWSEFWRPPAIVLLSGMLAVAFDYVMEPVAIRLDYWSWTGGEVPVQNYVAWFVIAVLLTAFHPRHRRAARNMGTAGRLAGFFVGIQAVFFIGLRIIWHFDGR